MKRIFIFLFALVLALGLCLVMLTPVAADPGTTYYVSTTGSDETGDGSWFYPWQTIQYAVSQVASGDTIEVAPGTYVEDPETVIDKNLSIHGAGSTQTTIKPSADTASNGQMVLVNPDVTMHISDVTFDGTGKKVWYALKYKGGGSVIDCDFTNIQYNPSGPNYQGIAICAYGEAYDDTIDFDDNVDITGCTFTGIGRVGVLYFGPGITDSTYSGNTYVGKGDGDWLDYALDVGSGPNVTITGSTVSDCRGVASSDGSTSGGIMVTDLYKGYCPAYNSTEATITGNNISGCTSGIYVGYDDSDLSVATINGNTMQNNRYQVDCTANVNVDLEATLANNTFDRAVVVRGSGIKVPTIFSSIQEAIDAASAGDTVNVMAGTYVEDLIIAAGKDGLDLKGSGSNVTTIKGVATAAGTPVYNIRFDEFDGVSGVKIHGFTIESPDVPTNHFASGMVLNGQDIEIYDNCFVSKGAESAVDNYCVAIQTWRWSAVPGSNITGLKIYDNTFSSEGDLWVYQGVFVNRDGGDFGDVTVSGNNFSGNVHMGIAYEGNNAVISDNDMTSTYEGTGIAIMDWAELEQDDVEVDGNELQGFNDGVLIGFGDQVMTNITVANNAFSDNRYQVRDRADTLNLDDVLAQNDFDRAVVVRGSGIKVPTVFSSIQDAIDAAVAGDTVDVAAGTYNENIIINKAGLILAGADKATTTIDSGGSGIVVTITGDNVTVSGFTITGSGSTPTTDGGVGLLGVTGCTIEDNIVSNNAGIGIGLQGADSNIIRDNILDANHIAGIGLLGSGGNTIERNTSTGTIEVILPVEPDNYVGYGIWLEYGSAGNTINDNTFSGNEIDGVYFGQGSDGNTLTNNIITNNGKVAGVDAHGVYFWRSGGNTVTGNTITGNLASGIQLYLSAGNTINYNNISGNTDYGINTDTTVDATANWWGDASGPYNATTNPSGTGDSVSDNVDYSPWWGANYIGVAHPWEWYTNDSIQDAIDAASADDTVNVMAGTYVEDLVIPAGKDGLELKGDGCNVTTIKGVATTEVTPVYNIRFDEFDGVSGVKIHGFTIESPDVPTNHFASGMVLNGQDIEIYDNCFVSKGAESAVDNYCVAIQTWRWSAAPDSDLTGLKIYDNTFSSEGDLWVYQGVFVNRDGEDFGDVTVSGNNFSGNIHMGIAYEGNNAVISDNAMTSTYEGVGIAVMDWAELGQDDVDVDGNELQGFDYGVLVGRGAQVMTNITVANNVFSNNNYQVRDRADTLNMEDVLAGNTFDRAVVVRGSGIKVPIIFSSIQDAIDAAVAGDTVDVGAGTYTHTAQIVIDKDLTIIGEDKETTIIEPASGFTDSYLFRINDGEVNLNNLTFDGKSNLYGGVRYAAPGTGSLNNNIFKNVVAPGYMGFGVVVFADNVTVSNNILTNIGRVGVWVGADNALVTGNTYTGKGAIDCLDYGIEVEMGGVATITDNTITNCLGVASSDNSTSAAILVTTYFGAGTEATITGNTLTNNTGGIAVGYDETDTSTVVAHYNNINGNTDYGIDTTAPSVDATANWWGAATGPYHDLLNPGGEGDTVSDNVLFEPWYGDEGMTTLVGHSTYEFVYDLPDVVVALEETDIPVTFQTDELGAVGYYGVRFKFDATGPGNVIFKATDSEEVEHTFVNSGFWGPVSGFNLTADYSATTDWSLNFSEPGEYNITFSLIEAPDGDVVAGIEGSEDITVRAVDILDHYRYLHEPYDEVTTLDLLAAADDWIVNAVPPGFDAPITTLQLLALADEWLSS